MENQVSNVPLFGPMLEKLGNPVFGYPVDTPSTLERVSDTTEKLILSGMNNVCFSHCGEHIDSASVFACIKDACGSFGYNEIYTIVPADRTNAETWMFIFAKRPKTDNFDDTIYGNPNSPYWEGHMTDFFLAAISSFRYEKMNGPFFYNTKSKIVNRILNSRTIENAPMLYLSYSHEMKTKRNYTGFVKDWSSNYHSFQDYYSFPTVVYPIGQNTMDMVDEDIRLTLEQAI